MNGKISIGEVLTAIRLNANGTTANVFSIEYWKSDGSLKSIPKAQRYVKSTSHSNSSEKSSFKYNLNEKESILLYDLDKKQHRTCLIYRIKTFNNLIVVH